MFMLRANLVLDSGSILGAWQGDTAEGNTAYVASASRSAK